MAPVPRVAFLVWHLVSVLRVWPLGTALPVQRHDSNLSFCLLERPVVLTASLQTLTGQETQCLTCGEALRSC